MLDLVTIRAVLAHYRKRFRCVRYGHDPVLVVTGPKGVMSLGGPRWLAEEDSVNPAILSLVGEPMAKKWACARCGATEGKGIQPT